MSLGHSCRASRDPSCKVFTSSSRGQKRTLLSPFFSRCPLAFCSCIIVTRFLSSPSRGFRSFLVARSRRTESAGLTFACTLVSRSYRPVTCDASASSLCCYVTWYSRDRVRVSLWKLARPSDIHLRRAQSCLRRRRASPERVKRR